jgi:hypothetical protein
MIGRMALSVLLNGEAALAQECGTCRLRDLRNIACSLMSSSTDLNNEHLHGVCRAAMHTFRREQPLSQHITEPQLKDTKVIAAITQPDPESGHHKNMQPASSPLNEHISPDPTSASQVSAPTPEIQQQVHDHADDLSLRGTNIVTYTAIEKRDGLSTIARRLLRDIPLRASVSLQKSFHPSDHVPRASDLGLGTVGLSAFMLSSLGNPTLRRVMVKEMWDSGADVLVR